MITIILIVIVTNSILSNLRGAVDFFIKSD